MSDLKDKEYSMLKENLENIGVGAEKYQANPDFEHPLPANIVKARYDVAEEELSNAWRAAQEKQKEANEAFDAYHLKFDRAQSLYEAGVRVVKGCFGIYNEKLRDFGIQPQKKTRKRKPKNP